MWSFAEDDDVKEASHSVHDGTPAVSGCPGAELGSQAFNKGLGAQPAVPYRSDSAHPTEIGRPGNIE